MDKKTAETNLRRYADAIIVLYDNIRDDEGLGRMSVSPYYPTLARLRAERTHWENVCKLYQ